MDRFGLVPSPVSESPDSEVNQQQSARDIPENSDRILTPTVTNQFACLTPLVRTPTCCRV